MLLLKRSFNNILHDLLLLMSISPLIGSALGREGGDSHMILFSFSACQVFITRLLSHTRWRIVFNFVHLRFEF